MDILAKKSVRVMINDAGDWRLRTGDVRPTFLRFFENENFLEGLLTDTPFLRSHTKKVIVIYQISKKLPSQYYDPREISVVLNDIYV